MGDWALLGNPCVGESEMEAAQTFGAQSTFVLPVPGMPGRFIFMADQWNPEDLRSSRHGYNKFLSYTSLGFRCSTVWILPAYSSRRLHI